MFSTSILSVVELNEKYYFLLKNGQMYYLDEKDNNMRYLGKLKIENDFYITAVTDKRKIYILPYQSCFICVYDPMNNRFEYKPYSTDLADIVEGGGGASVISDCSIYTIYGESNSIIKYDVLNNQLSEVAADWSKEFERRYGHKPIINAIQNLCLYSGKLWIPLNEKKLILQIDLKTERYCFCKIGKYDIEYNFIIGMNGKMYLTGDLPIIVEYDIGSKKTIVYNDFPHDFRIMHNKNSWKGAFSSGIIVRDSIYYAPLDSNQFIIFNTRNHELTKVFEIPNGAKCHYSHKIWGELVYVEVDAVGNEIKKIGSYILHNEEIKDERNIYSNLFFKIADETESEIISFEMCRGMLKQWIICNLLSF